MSVCVCVSLTFVSFRFAVDDAIFCCWMSSSGGCESQSTCSSRLRVAAAAARFGSRSRSVGRSAKKIRNQSHVTVSDLGRPLLVASVGNAKHGPLCVGGPDVELLSSSNCRRIAAEVGEVAKELLR